MERSKYGFPVATVIAVAALFLASQRPAAAADPHQLAMDLRQNTVRIEARFAEEPPELGFGFIVGERDGRLYAVTAYHVVADPHDAPGRPPVKVRVELFTHREEMIEARSLALHDGPHDLAVITFPAPDGFQWNRKCLGTEQQRAMTDVTFVGRNQQWYVPTSTVKISSEQPEDERFAIDDLAVRPGSSGGPLIASSGIIGMILRDSSEGAQALTIGMIRTDFNKWVFPFQLESSSTPAAAAIVDKKEPAPAAEPMSKGEAIAKRNPLSAALREQQPEGAGRRGFDAGMVAAENQTAWGPGKQKILDSLSGAEQDGFRAAAYFSVDHNAYILRAEVGAAIAEADPVVMKARMREQDAAFWLGFDIATAIFGDPKRGAQGNTATGPGSLGIRDSLNSPASRRGFNASVALHLARRY